LFGTPGHRNNNLCSQPLGPILARQRADAKREGCEIAFSASDEVHISSNSKVTRVRPSTSWLIDAARDDLRYPTAASWANQVTSLPVSRPVPGMISRVRPSTNRVVCGHVNRCQPVSQIVALMYSL